MTTTKPLSPAAALKSLQAKHKKLSTALERLSKASDAVDTVRLEVDNALEVLAEAQNRPAAPVAAKPVRNGSKKAQAKSEEE
jgi:hypothetical protein